MKLVLFALFVVVTLGAWGQTSVPEPVWSGVDGGPSPALSRLWAAVKVRLAADGAGRGTGVEGVRTFVSGRPGAYSLVFQPVSDPSAAKYLPLGDLDARDALAWARTVESLARTLSPPVLEPGPTLVDAFEITGQGVDLPGPVGAPTGIASRGDRLWVALGSTVLEVDDRWMVTGQPSRPLTSQGPNLAWSLAVSPAGTLWLRSVDGVSLWSLAPGGVPRAVGPTVPSAGQPFGVLADGTVFAVGSQPKVVRLWTASGYHDLALGADALVTAAAPGPENTLWLWDASRGTVTVTTSEGDLRDLVVPDVPPGTVVMRLRVDADGWFWAVTNHDLRRFRPDGSLAWSWAGEPGATPGFGALGDVAPGGPGVVYYSDFATRRVYRLAVGPVPALEAVARAAAAVRTAPSATGWRALAEAYQAQGAVTASLDAWDHYLDARPADAGARETRGQLALGLAKAQAAAGAAEARRLLETLGPESARDAYHRAMTVLEGLRVSAPGDPDVTSAWTDLRRRFAAAEEAPPPAPVPLVSRVELANLFPSLFQVYPHRPVGSAVVSNTLGEPLVGLSAEVMVPHYMDFPSSGPVVDRVAPGDQVDVPLVVALSDRVLDLEEDLPVQAQVTLKWTDSRGPRSLQVTRSLTLYRRTALTWDDTAHLASFVTPREETVARAAFQLVPVSTGYPWGSRNLEVAAALADGLGTLPLRYVPDPQTGYQTAAADPSVVDTVRFPRTTLGYRGGDCDDTTALLSSLYEAVGVPTAFVTTPGHVFLALDTGEPASSAWLFSDPGLGVLVRSGTVWVPVETTVLAEGFGRAWARGAELVARYQGTADFQFVPVAVAQETYRPLPLPPSPLAGPVFDPAAVARRTSTTRSDVGARFLTAVPGVTGNRLARFQAVWGRPDLAQKTLEALVAQNPSPAAYLNLATLARAQGDEAAAARWLAAAQRSTAPGGEALVAAYAGAVPPGPARGASVPLPPWQE